MVGISAVEETQKEFSLNIFILNPHLEIEEDKEMKLGNIKKINYPHSFILSDNGFIFFLNGIKEGKNAEQSNVGLENRLYQLFRFDPLEDKLKQYDVTISDKFISDVKMKLDKDENLLITGFYNESHYKGAEGVFLMVIDRNDGSLLHSGKRPLDNKILTDFLNEKELRRSRAIDNLYLDHFYINDDGNITLIAEIFFVEQRLVTGANGINVSTTYLYNWEDILVVELDENLNYVLHNTIRKKQKSSNFLSPYWSYSLMEKDDGSKCLLYNYLNNRKGNSIITATSANRSSTYFNDLWQNKGEERLEFKNLHFAPAYTSFFQGSYGVVQDKGHYQFFKLLNANN